MADQKQVDTGGGASVAGDPQTDGNLIGRDQHTHGDTVSGDKIINITAAPSTVTGQGLPLPPRWQRAITANTILKSTEFYLIGL